MNQIPSIATHVPVTQEIPEEGKELAVGRADIPPPSLWQQSVMVTHKLTKKKAVVARVDWGTNMFRAFFPDEGDIDPTTGKPMGRFSNRTEWEQCHNWDVEVTFSPQEMERQAARAKLQIEMSRLDPKEVAAVMVLVDEDDPAKALGKLEALRMLGVIKAAPEAAQAAIAEVKKVK